MDRDPGDLDSIPGPATSCMSITQQLSLLSSGSSFAT